MAFCPSLKTFSHDTLKAASQLEKNGKSDVEQMRIENEPGDFPEKLKNVFDPLFQYLSSFAQSHFSILFHNWDAALKVSCEKVFRLGHTYIVP